MTILNPTILSPPSFFSTGFKPNQLPYKIKIKIKHKPNSILPFSSNSPLSQTKTVRFFARLSRPSNRRNSLREKLTQHLPRHLNEVTSNPPTENDGANASYSSFDQNIVENSKFDDSKKRVSEKIDGGNVDVFKNESLNDSDKIETSYSNFDKYGVEENKFDDSNKRISEENDGSNVDGIRTESLGDSDLRSKLERWADKYKADYEFWGLGFNPIFTVFKNKEGKIDKVVVNEDEILERNGVEPEAYRRSRSDVGFVKVSTKIFHAKFLAREMESGNYEIPKSSSLAKVLALEKNTGFVESIRGFCSTSNFPMKNLSKIGIVVLCSFFVVWAIKGLFTGGEAKEEYTSLEKEMLRRKIKARKEREKLVKGSVEVIDNPLETKLASFERPSLDKEELLSSIMKAKPFADKPVVQESFSNDGAKSNEFDAKIMEIREMARHARKTERENSLSRASDDMGEFDFDDLSIEEEVVEEGGDRVVDITNGLSDSHSPKIKEFSEIFMPFFSNDLKNEHIITNKDASVKNSETQTPNSSTAKAFDSGAKIVNYVINPEEEANLYNNDTQVPTSSKSKALDSRENIVKDVICPEESVKRDPIKNIDTLNGQAVKAKSASGKKPRVITSVREAKEFLSQQSEPMEEPRGKIIHDGGDNVSNKGEKETDINTKKSKEKGNVVIDKTISGESNIGSERIPSAKNENWMENNFQTLEPLMKKIGDGYRENYTVAREKIKQELDLTPSMDFTELDNGDDELDWMKDDKLREIVFQVRDNELTGRDPFYLMDEEDKLAFFEGLEKKVEKENEKLSKLHEYLHSNIENLDYGANGMSVYDPPEKIIPRWKGPPINRNQNQNPEFLENFEAQRRTLVNGTKNQEIKSENGLNSLDENRESPSNGKILPNSDLNDQIKKSPKTIIEGSDGSLRAGEKTGKEFWEHTKKWSQGFLDSYNAETDPEIKAVMKDMGKDLDRWITPKEIQEAADLMDELPEKKKEFVNKKLSKVRREMELFGPQAVLSKYKEYGDQKEEDYLWWLDLPFVLCIELYTNDNEEQRIGLYSLEMAEDLELDPKPIHVIAFEDPGDCKNLCYIIQAHMEMLGNGNAFVVARPPKDAFREVKANGFSVTVIRKGELQLNVDQTLEEVEEQITEIGTKIYHDKIMGEQSVDMSGLMKGVFGARKPSKRRRSKRRLKGPTK